jgi:hypothetical protein
MESTVIINRKTRELLKQIDTKGQTGPNYRRFVSLKDKTTPGGTGIIMNNLQSDSAVCDGIECYSRPDSTFQIKVGEQRTISLSLCQSCKTKISAHSSTKED